MRTSPRPSSAAAVAASLLVTSTHPRRIALRGVVSATRDQFFFVPPQRPRFHVSLSCLTISASPRCRLQKILSLHRDRAHGALSAIRLAARVPLSPAKNPRSARRGGAMPPSNSSPLDACFGRRLRLHVSPGNARSPAHLRGSRSRPTTTAIRRELPSLRDASVGFGPQ